MTNYELALQMTNDRFGDWAEGHLAAALQRNGWIVTRKPGSLGASDMTATLGQSKWYIQVKATREVPELVPAQADKTRVIQSANSSNATPVMGLLWFGTPDGQYRFINAQTGEHLQVP